MPSAADNIIGIYERHARDYESDRGRSLFEKPWLDQFAALLPPGGTVLDIGCGCAEPIAAYFISQGFAVTGVDSAPSLIAACRNRFPDHDWQTFDMRALDLAKTFDGLIAWDSFFHLPPEDQRRMFAIFRKHAAPNAALMFTSGPSHGEAVGDYRGNPLYHASLDPVEYRALLDGAGFHVVAHVAQDPDCGGHTVWLAQRSSNAP
jgi:SAM-dependent methyltransferase